MARLKPAIHVPVSALYSIVRVPGILPALLTGTFGRYSETTAVPLKYMGTVGMERDIPRNCWWLGVKLNVFQAFL